MGDKEGEDDDGPSILERLLSVGKRCLGVIAKGSPPEPCDEVRVYLRQLGITQKHLLDLYSVFHYLAQAEDEEALLTTVHVISSDTLALLVEERRKYVMRLLRCILKLGDCQEEATWDKFLWVLLRFCSLNRVELAQALFLCILKIRDSTTYHYIRAAELQEFFGVYKKCPVKAFDTSEINFDLLPLRRYYASDFAELLMRFNILLHPILHLQQSLQAKLPGLDFWDNCTGNVSFCRKITFDFFLMETGRIFLRGEPPFRETCDMLCPDALGAIPMNQDQWILRTWVAKSANGLAQLHVWGEQASPEVMELRRIAREEEEERERIRLEKKKIEDEQAIEKLAEVQASGISLSKDRAGSKPPSEEGMDDPEAQRKKKEAEMEKLRLEAEAKKRAAEPQLDLAALTRTAAVLDETYAAPVDALPPSWMKQCTIAPAIQVRGPDPPVPRPLKEPPRNDNRTVTDRDLLKQARLEGDKTKSKEAGSASSSKPSPEKLGATAMGKSVTFHQ
eukprot:gb/GFBE01044548.1/.p1 GENE.gb/GFBE01044548.1/~~gb/GFBE01044548.1/.p1  ORF type:complete len:506 (+),score=117.05 gb/GFBE01044548.1/:1-1518(+)